MMSSARLTHVLDAWCRTVYRRASQLVVLSPGFKSALAERGVPEDEISVIYNWSNETDTGCSEPNPQLAKVLGIAGKFTVVFAGNLGKVQGLDAVLRAAEVLAADGRVLFACVGDGIEADTLRRWVTMRGLTNGFFADLSTAI